MHGDCSLFSEAPVLCTCLPSQHSRARPRPRVLGHLPTALGGDISCLMCLWPVNRPRSQKGGPLCHGGCWGISRVSSCCPGRTLPRQRPRASPPCSGFLIPGCKAEALLGNRLPFFSISRESAVSGLSVAVGSPAHFSR